MTLLQQLGVALRMALARLASRGIPAPGFLCYDDAVAAGDWLNFHYAMQAAMRDAVGEAPGAGYELFKGEMTGLQNRGCSLEEALTRFAEIHSGKAARSLALVTKKAKSH
jgi:hypothetical protein